MWGRGTQHRLHFSAAQPWPFLEALIFLTVFMNALPSLCSGWGRCPHENADVAYWILAAPINHRDTQAKFHPDPFCQSEAWGCEMIPLVALCGTASSFSHSSAEKINQSRSPDIPVTYLSQSLYDLENTLFTDKTEFYLKGKGLAALS